MKLEKKYGLFTAIGMVVGIVIGSGVFFKAQSILEMTNGNVAIGILAWIIGGINMIICACTFAVMATKYEKVNGIIDYAEALVGKKYGYYFGWFMYSIYYPAMTSVLVWVCARYAGELFGWGASSNNVMALGVAFLVFSYALNVLSPKLAGKFQVSTTVIKLIPLVLMALAGIIYGLCKTTVTYQVVGDTIQKIGDNQLQILIHNFSQSSETSFQVLLAATISTVFAYEGWIVATSINAELKDSKKNLPIALLLGALIIIVVYICYYIGVAGGATVDVLITGGAKYAFLEIFGDFFGTILNVFVVISCMGTLNGLMIACSRGLYSLAERDLGPKPEVFKQIDPKTNMPNNSSAIGLLVVGVWYVFFFAACLSDTPWFGKFAFDSSELPIVTIYAMYIPIFVMMIVKDWKTSGVFKGIILPLLAIISSCFMVFAAIYSHRMGVVYYLCVYLIVMGASFFFYKKKENTVVEVLSDSE